MDHKEGCCCHRGGHFFVVVGMLAFVYGFVNYLRVVYVWPPYAGWLIGGLILIVIGWTRKYWLPKK